MIKKTLMVAMLVLSCSVSINAAEPAKESQVKSAHELNLPASPKEVYELGLDLEALGTISKNVLIFVYQSSADDGYAPAQYKMGNILEDGEWVEKDDMTAISWYEIAAKNGDLASKRKLLHLYPKYTHVMGVKTRLLKLREFFANEGESSQKGLLGLDYVYGNHGTKDIKKGLYLLNKAARNKDYFSAKVLYSLFNAGKILKRDENKAFYYLNLAIEIGHKEEDYILISKMYLLLDPVE